MFKIFNNQLVGAPIGHVGTTVTADNAVLIDTLQVSAGMWIDPFPSQTDSGALPPKVAIRLNMKFLIKHNFNDSFCLIYTSRLKGTMFFILLLKCQIHSDIHVLLV